MPKLNAQIRIFSRISFLEKLLFTKHLATMVKAGIPVPEAFATLIEQSKSQALIAVLKGILKQVENGQSLAKAMQKHPKVFDQFYISLIEVGEESGALEENLEFLAKQLAKDYNLRKKIQGAMFYPALVFGATFVMGGFISLFILPKLIDFFSAFDIELPLTTRILLFFANLMKNYGLFVIVGVVAFIFIMSNILRLPKIKPKWHAIILKAPLFGRLIAYGQLARFCRNLATLLKSGVPVTKSLEVTARTLSNLKFSNDLYKVAQRITEGKNIGEILEQKGYGEFPPLVSKMVHVGEKTGKLEETLAYLGDFYEEEIDDISKNLTAILEPIMLLTIGLVVGFVALAIISPIYELTGSIRGRK